MWACFYRKVHMTIVIITFYISMCSISASIQSDLKKSSEAEMPSLQLIYNNATGIEGNSKDTDLYQPQRSDFCSLSDEMKDLINFIDLRERGKSAKSKRTKDSKVVVDLDEAKLDVVGEPPKEAAILERTLTEEGVIVDIPKSSLFREKRSNMFRNKNIPPEIRLYYKTSTPRFRDSQREFITTRLLTKMYKAIINPLKKMNFHKTKQTKRSHDYPKPVGLFNIGGQNNPKFCHASHSAHRLNHNTKSYFKKSKKMTEKHHFFTSDKRGHQSLNFTKNSEISEAALFQIINKLIQDSTENKTLDNFDIKKPTEKAVSSKGGHSEDIDRKSKLKVTSTPPQTTNPYFNLAVIIAKITHAPEYPSTTPMLLTNPQSIFTSFKHRWNEKTSSASSFAKIREKNTKPIFEKKFKEKLKHVFTETVSTPGLTYDKCKMEKIHEVNLTQQQSKEGMNNLLKEIIRHVSIALEAVSTSKEFLELIPAETSNIKSTASDSTTCNPLCSDFDGRSNWQKIRDSCMKTGMTSNQPNSSTQSQNYHLGDFSTTQYITDEFLRNNFSSVSIIEGSINVDCENISTSTQCSVFLDDEEEYLEELNMTGYAPFLEVPEDDSVAEDYPTVSCKVKKIEIGSPLKIKRNRKDNTTIETQDRDEPGVYEARELIKELERYHTMLKEPIVTKIWRFFEVSTRRGTSKLSNSSLDYKIRKRKSEKHLTFHKTVEKRQHPQHDRAKSINMRLHEDCPPDKMKSMPNLRDGLSTSGDLANLPSNRFQRG